MERHLAFSDGSVNVTRCAVGITWDKFQAPKGWVIMANLGQVYMRLEYLGAVEWTVL